MPRGAPPTVAPPSFTTGHRAAAESDMLEALESEIGKHASSRYRVLEELAGGAAAVVEWRLDTGRTHQIRVHAQHIGHPLVADTTYGGTCGAALQRFEGSQGQKRELERELGEFGRPCLHARTLGFTHPVSGERLGFESPVPPDMIRLLEALRSNAP